VFLLTVKVWRTPKGLRGWSERWAENKQNETNKNDDDVRRVGGLAGNERCRASKYNLF
jgi:hypothetical protein